MIDVKKNKVKLYNSDMPTVTAPLIDKLSVVVDLYDAGLCGYAFSGMLDWIQQHEIGIVKVPVGGKYHLGVNVHGPDQDGVISIKNPSVLFQITNPKCTHRQLRFEYNPADMTEAFEAYLDGLITEMLGITFYELMYHGRFTRIDICRNIAQRDMEDYLFRSRFKFSQCYFGADGKQGSITFGKPKYNQVCVYNKAKELYGIHTPKRMLRIETRNRINLKATELAAFHNPFKRVMVYSLACKNPPFGIGHWNAFQDSCRLRGVNNAIKHQPTKYRAKLKAILSNQPVIWWDMDDGVWDALYSAAFENAGLCDIPNSAPPLTLAFHIGCAA